VSTRDDANESLGILILAGGEATRLPGKLMLAVLPGDADEPAARGPIPMIVHVYRNLRGAADGEAREIVIASKATFAPAVDAALPVPLVIDRWAGRGPLAGMLSAFGRMRSRFVFAVAGDAPFVDAAFVHRLDRLRVASDTDTACEAYVPILATGDDRQIEPLAAIYDRLAFAREGLPVLRSGRGSLRAVIDRLRTNFVAIDDARVFTNVNTPGDYAALRPRDQGESI